MILLTLSSDVKLISLTVATGFPDGAVVKNLPANAGHSGSIRGSGRSSGEGNGNPLQYSCLGNPMDRGAWKAPGGSLGSQKVGHDWAHIHERLFSAMALDGWREILTIVSNVINDQSIKVYYVKWAWCRNMIY